MRKRLGTAVLSTMLSGTAFGADAEPAGKAVAEIAAGTAAGLVGAYTLAVGGMLVGSALPDDSCRGEYWVCFTNAQIAGGVTGWYVGGALASTAAIYGVHHLGPHDRPLRFGPLLTAGLVASGAHLGLTLGIVAAFGGEPPDFLVPVVIGTSAVTAPIVTTLWHRRSTPVALLPRVGRDQVGATVAVRW